MHLCHFRFMTDTVVRLRYRCYVPNYLQIMGVIFRSMGIRSIAGLFTELKCSIRVSYYRTFSLFIPAILRHGAFNDEVTTILDSPN